LHDRPPEQKAGQQKARILDSVRPMGPQGELKGGGKMPSDYGDGARQPAKDGVRKMVFEPLQVADHHVALTEAARDPAQ
jgi:hypothetical protein